MAKLVQNTGGRVDSGLKQYPEDAGAALSQSPADAETTSQPATHCLPASLVHTKQVLRIPRWPTQIPGWHRLASVL